MNIPDGPLVSTEWLAAHLLSPDLRIIDVRGKVLPPGHSPRYLGKRGDYEAAHLPGARFVDWTRDIVDVDGMWLARFKAPDAHMVPWDESDLLAVDPEYLEEG